MLLHPSASSKHAAHASATKELGEQVFCRDSATHSAVSVEALLAVLVIDLSLLGIRQNLVARNEKPGISEPHTSNQILIREGIRMADLLELVRGIGGVCVLVGVVFLFGGEGNG